MKKRVVLVALCMAVWGMAAYSLGRHHGVTKGPMEVPSVKVQWRSKSAKPTAEAADVHSTASCSSVEEAPPSLTKTEKK